MQLSKISRNTQKNSESEGRSRSILLIGLCTFVVASVVGFYGFPFGDEAEKYAVAGLLTILLKGESSEIYNLGSKNKLSILEFAKLVSLASGSKIVSKDSPVDYVHSPNPVILPNVKKLESLGWSCQVSENDGVVRTLAWARETR